MYSPVSNQPFNVYGCAGNFAIVSFTNKMGAPILSKDMGVATDKEGTENVLVVKLLPHETVDLYGKYIYQITLRDVDGIVEIPKQGILYVTNNINKNFIAQ